MNRFLMIGDADHSRRFVVKNIEAYHCFPARLIAPIPGCAQIESSLALEGVSSFSVQ